MIEVFKTNVERKDQASMLLRRIHEAFKEYKANFDLEDCDRILRVECNTGEVGSSEIIRLLSEQGYYAEVLQDIVPVAMVELLHKSISVRYSSL